MATKTRHDWTKLDPIIDNLKAQGWNDTQIAKDLGIGRQTLVDHLRNRNAGTPKAQPSTPESTVSGSEDQYAMEHLGTLESTEMVEVHQSTPEHQGTLEGYQEVLEDVQDSVPEMRQLVPDEEHPSTPEVHQEVSADDSSLAHSGVPARQDALVSTPMVHPSTPTAEDWQLWTAMKMRWGEIEKMLADWHTRQALLSTPSGTPRHTMKKTYVIDSLYVELIDRYAQEQSVELKDVVNLAFHEFFERREYLPEDTR